MAFRPNKHLISNQKYTEVFNMFGISPFSLGMNAISSASSMYNEAKSTANDLRNDRLDEKRQDEEYKAAVKNMKNEIFSKNIANAEKIAIR